MTKSLLEKKNVKVLPQVQDLKRISFRFFVFWGKYETFFIGLETETNMQHVDFI